MYWYLARLCLDRTRLIDHIDLFVADRQFNLRGKIAATDCQASAEYLRTLRNISETTRLLSEALWKFFTLLKALNIISTPKREFAIRQLLYEARMKPYLTVTNDRIPDAQAFEEATRQSDDVETTCKAIDEGIKQAKSLLTDRKKVTPEEGKYVGTEEQWKKEIKQMETSCVAVAVAASQLLRVHQKYRKEELGSFIECTLETRYHEWWVVPQLKEKVK